MRRVSNKPARVRPYRSDLRAEQAEDTRTRILDATLRVIRGGIANVSVPIVAREAGVSVPTVYRHFPSKRALLEAVYPHVVRGIKPSELPVPRSLDEVRGGVRMLFERIDAYDDADRAALASPGAAQVRRATMPARLAIGRRVAASLEPRLRPADRDRIARILTVLTTSSSLGLWRDHMGSSVDQAADDIASAIGALIRAALDEAAA